MDIAVLLGHLVDADATPNAQANSPDLVLRLSYTSYTFNTSAPAPASSSTALAIMHSML